MIELTPEQTYATQHLERLDAVTRKMEATWGVDRLPKCVDPELAAKWDRQWAKLCSAIDEARHVEVGELCEGCIRGWGALERAALANGYKPDEGKIMEFKMASGVVIRVCSSRTDADKPQPPGYEAYTLEQVANMINSQRLVTVIARDALKQANPHEKPASKLPPEFWASGGDAIPF